MPTKKITDLQLRDDVEDTCNFPVDDTIQTYRVTATQIKEYVLATNAITTAMITDANVTRSKLASGAVAPFTVVSKTNSDSPYTALTTDDIIKCDATSGAITVNLYAASGNSGKTLLIKKTDSSSNAVTVDANSTETIDGNLTRVLAAQHDFIKIVCDGSNWIIVNEKTTSEVFVDSGNGHGSTNTKIRRFSNIRKNIGSGITYADSAGNGATFTINEAGVYSINYQDSVGGSATYIGITVNGTSLTSNISSIASYSQGARAVAYSADSGVSANPSWTGRLEKNDIVRAHTNGANNDAGATSLFSITKVS